MTDSPRSSPSAPEPTDITRRYADDEVAVRIRGLGSGRPPMLHIEHKNGAALIVPRCDERPRSEGPELTTLGFDGTVFRLLVDEASRTLRLETSAPSVILGGRTTRTLLRGHDIVRNPVTRLRLTGDEVTMPIGVADADRAGVPTSSGSALETGTRKLSNED